MAYTPPLGSAVDFTGTGVPYTPPLGSAVNFEPSDAVGTSHFALPLTVAAVGAHGEAGFGAVCFGVVHGEGEQPPTAVFRNPLPLTVAATGEVDACASARFAPFGVFSRGLSSYVCAASFPLPFNALGVGVGAETTAEAFFAPFVVESEGVFLTPYLAGSSFALPLAVAAQGAVAPAAVARVPLALHVSAFGGVGVNAQARVDVFRVAARGHVGRTGGARIPLSFKVAGRGACGANVSARMSAIGVLGLGHVAPAYYCTAEISPFTVQATGYHPTPRRRHSIYVVDAPKGLYVR